MLAGSDWNPAGLLGEFLDSHALTPEISAALHDAGIVVKGVTPGTATGTGFADVIVGAAGNDVIAGGEGDDVLLGREGGDTLSGEAGMMCWMGRRCWCGSFAGRLCRCRSQVGAGGTAV
ncbi:MAG: hypothetical protein IPH08_05810 [Rhodocyclaceae bacterium]|nr:hypothetical protein [Rhodocyclaceae bacterium]